jgi:predicted sulfurtransferase
MIASAAAEPEPEERVGQHDDEPSLNLLFYFYCEVADPSALAADQRALCLRLGLRGRVRVASEGINATLSGTTAACDEYARILR